MLFIRNGERLRLHGVTYGPFALNTEGFPFPGDNQVHDDFLQMQAAGINSIRAYHLPPKSLLAKAEELDMSVFVDIPWPKHVCFLESEKAQKAARQAVRAAVERGRNYTSVVAYSIGNEIPPSIVRWHGARKVERFLAELCDTAKQVDPHCLVTYANYPPTEYLNLNFLDFITFNVYLHSREAFRRYLFRLQNLYGHKPLVLGEIGMDTLRHGEQTQAEFLAGHAEEAILMGLAGVYVFSWTDEWHTGGHSIKDWAFGITKADRSPKRAFHELQEVFERSPAEFLPETPRVSVVVCTYNGGRTLEQCLRSLRAVNYADYEVIVVDDGSTDNTRSILSRFPEVRAIHQSNQGLSQARNMGLQAATGSIVAYTDSDCYVDPDWLSLLVGQLLAGEASAVGGPNLTPDDGRLAACVAASPGQPMHVLESDQVAEHIPGCNMAFRRDALLAINGFDPQFRKAGDDVDICWRLQQAGQWITYAPGAFVWHHRRQTPKAYLRQQAGYGEAEALLRFKHPDRFNGRGDGIWRGALYGVSLQGLRLGQSLIYRGTFGTGLFQCIYQHGPAHWAMLPSTLEWHIVALLMAVTGLYWTGAWVGVALMVLLSALVAVLRCRQATLPSHYDSLASRFRVAALCYAQPLVRSWQRYQTRFFAYHSSRLGANSQGVDKRLMPMIGRLTVNYWSEEGHDRIQFLKAAVDHFDHQGWNKTLDSGWSSWDMEIHCHPWTVLRAYTAQEDHGGGKHLIRVGYRLRLSEYAKPIGAMAALVAAAAAALVSWPLAIVAVALFLSLTAMWISGAYRSSHAIRALDRVARELGLVRCEPRSAAE
jgi:GT2 family glycosyltransferase